MLTFANLIKTMPAKKKLALLILDGWGKGDHSKADAIWNAKTPFVDGLMKKYPNSELNWLYTESDEGISLTNIEIVRCALSFIELAAI